MTLCVTCKRDLPAGSRFCPACGSAATPPVESGGAPAPGATVDAPAPSSTPATPRETDPPRRPGGGSSPGAPAGAVARFVPGAIIGERYRIVGLLGRGGMGEVYRADDLRLGDSVALKFLPRSLSGAPEALERLRAEVRLTRQISHPNVCRVHDIAEADGEAFISMEFIDGEDLEALLRRIGRLPGDKAVDIARQLCAGLAAAHERGVLHRDLKPANIMLDGRGRVRITDFGIAALVGPEERGGEVAGTPSYMAPEQLRGETATPRSDVYSLALVLYEIFTGRRGIEAGTLEEIRRFHDSATPSSLSSHVGDIDPAVERLVLQCLAREARDRPASPLAVAAALPGGDPLMEALAAGETPSPELVASAGGCGKLSMVGGGALLIAIIAGLILIALADRRVRLSERLELRLPPQVLEHQARSIIEGLGYTDPPRDRARGFGWRHDLLQVIEENDSSAERWQRLGEEGADVLRFWYRQSPRLMIPDTDSGRLLVWKPPVIQPGMVSVTLTSTGRLATFQAVPPRRTRAEGKPAELDWSIALEAAGFQPEQLEAAEPSVTPLTACDRRVAWSAPHPTLEGVRQRIDAASFQGRPVSFLVHETWTLPGRAGGSTRSFFAAMSDWAYNILLFIALVGGIWFAWSNISQGRGDRRGATRVAVYYLLLSSIVWLLTADHVSDAAGEIVLLVRALSRALFHAMLAWFLYVALEPTVRRIWPRKLVSWNRLLSGRLRDPLVGRDLLLGIAAGVATTLVLRLHYLAVGWLGAPPPRPLGMGLDFLLGPRHVIGKILWLHAEAALGAVIGVFIFVAALTVAKRPWVGLAILLVVGIARIPYGVVSDLLAVDICFRALAVACLLAGIQIGLLGLAAGLFTHFLLESSVLSLNPDAWYSASGLTAAAVLIGFALVDALCACRGRSGFPAPAPAAPPLSAAGLEPGKR